MSTIEKAAQRLEELRRAGIEVPAPGAAAPGRRPGETPEALPLPERAVRAMESGGTRAAAARAAGADSASAAAVEIDLARLRLAGMVTPDAPRGRIADEFRVVKRPLLDNVHGRNATPFERANLVLVTSATAGEGKTFTAVNLAMSIAMELDTTVLLVDADVARPTIPALLGIPESRGLLDLLVDPALRLSDLILRTNVPKLAILPVGTAHDGAAELLASQAMARLLDELATSDPRRVVVFDGAPVLVTTESRAMAAQMGQVILVVAANRTTHGAIEEAVAALHHCPVVMTLLNKSTRTAVGSYYGSDHDARQGSPAAAPHPSEAS